MARSKDTLEIKQQKTTVFDYGNQGILFSILLAIITCKNTMKSFECKSLYFVMPSSKSSLLKLRKEIDSIDKNLLAMLKRRFSLCKDIALYKKKHNLPIFQEKREKDILKNVNKKSEEGALSKDFIASFYRIIFKESRKLQKDVAKKFTLHRTTVHTTSGFLTKTPKRAKIKRTIN